MKPDSKHVRTERLPGGGARVTLDLRPWNKVGFPEAFLDYRAEVASDGQLAVGLAPGAGRLAIMLPMRYASARFRRGQGQHSVISVGNPLHEVFATLAGTLNSSHYIEALVGSAPDAREQALRIDAENRKRQIAAQHGDYREWEMRDRRMRGMRARMYARFFNAFWRRVEPLLDAEALRLARSVDGGLEAYNALAARSDLKDLARVSRPAAAMVSRIVLSTRHQQPRMKLPLPEFPRGTKLPEMLRALMAALRGNPGPAPTPGFVKWAKAAKLGPSLCCRSSIHDVVQAMWDADLDPNGIAKVSSRRAWYCLHALAVKEPRLLPTFLRDPENAANLVYEFHPPHLQTGPRMLRIARVVHEMHDAFRVQRPPRGRGIARRLHVAEALIADLEDGLSPEFLTLGFPALLERTKRWHQDEWRRAQEAAESKERAMDEAFPQPAFGGFEDKKFKLVWLSTPRMLAQEGAAMRHCVGSYAPQCKRGATAIYGFRDAEGRRIATLELRGWKVGQFYGHQDSLPAPAHRRWVDRAVGKARKEAEKSGVPAAVAEVVDEWDEAEALMPF